MSAPTDDNLATPLPVIGLRPIQGRSGTTLLMELLGTAPAVVFDRRYPAEYRFLSYFAQMVQQMTEPFDPSRHTGVTPFFFGEGMSWGPIPFESEAVDIAALAPPLLSAIWSAWSNEARRAQPGARWYAEKLAVPVEPILDAGIDVRVIDLVRDPRDLLASIRAFTAGGVDGFGRDPLGDEDAYLARFVAGVGDRLDEMAATPAHVDRLVIRYEDLVTDLDAIAERLGGWLDIELDALAAVTITEGFRHHRTTGSAELSIGRWQQDLVPGEAAVIANSLESRMRPLGYEF